MSFKLPWGASQQRSADKNEVSLNDILPTTALRIELTLLVVLCTDRMRECLTTLFEDLTSPQQNKDSEDLLGDRLILENHDSAPSEVTGHQRSDLAWARRRELASVSMQDLKHAGVTSFNAWRTDVLRRMGEALSVQPGAVKRAKAEHVAAQKGLMEAKRYQEYVAWAEGAESPESVSGPSSPKSGFPPQFENVATPLLKLDERKRALILNSCLYILLSLENYSARSRTLMQYLCSCLELSIDILTSCEATLALTLIKSTLSTEMNADDARHKKAAQDATARRWKVGLATAAGALVVGVTGGLAAPLLLGAAGAVMGGIGLGGLASLLGATIANPVTVAALFGAFGGRMSGNAMERYAKEVEDFSFIPVHGADSASSDTNPASIRHRLRVVVGVSGWILDDVDVSRPWRALSADSFEVFALLYEKSALMELAVGLNDVLRNSAYSLAQAGAMQVVLPALSAALLPVGLLKFGRLLDNPFSVAMERSDKAGKVLAAALVAKAQGERPVTLIGYSMGARVIYSCLQELVAQKAFGLVETAVLVGAPAPSDEMAWRKMRAIVTGRLVNVYTTRDLLLGCLYRMRNAQLNIAGLQPIAGVDGVENKDVSSFVAGHNQLGLAMGKVLKEIGLQDLEMNEVEKEEAELEAEDKMEKVIHQRARAEGLLDGQEDQDGRIMMIDTTGSEGSSFHEHMSDAAPSIHHESVVHDVQKLDLETHAEQEHENENASSVANIEENEESDGEAPSQMTHLIPSPEPEPESGVIKKTKKRRSKPTTVVMIDNV